MMVQEIASSWKHVGIAMVGFIALTLQSLVASTISIYFALVQCYRTQINVLCVNKNNTQTSGLVGDLGM